MSTITLVGNITRLELRFTQSGQAIVNFGVAENYKRGDDERTSFYDCVAFGSLAENLAESELVGGKDNLVGARVIVTGRMQQSTWEDKQTGDKRSKMELVADEVGPSCRWMAVTAEKSENGSNGQSRPPARQSSGSRGRSAPARNEYPDEDPF